MLHDNGKEMLMNTLEEYIYHVSDDKNTVSEVKDQLGKYGITGARVESVLGNVEILEDADLRELILITEQIYLKTRIMALNPSEWFTEYEIKTARQFDKRLLTEELPVTDVLFENVLLVGNGVYLTTITPSKISELMKTQFLNYNQDIQRQGKVQKRNDKVIVKPTVYKKNVKEIKELMLKGLLKNTMIAFNAAIGTSDSGEELYFDSSKGTLTVSMGTQLDILDGFHRCLASIEASQEDTDLDFKFILMISNYSTREAQTYQAQLAKATPFPTTRIQELEASRLADTVVQMLRVDSELEDRISSHHAITPSAGQLVSYKVLADSIEREFPMKFRRDTAKVAEYLREFFDHLIAEYSDEFVYNSKDNSSLMKYNKMFAGYVALAAKMQKEDIAIEKMNTILDKIDFSRTNSLWIDIGVMTSKGKVSVHSDERKIANYFKQLEIK